MTWPLGDLISFFIIAFPIHSQSGNVTTKAKIGYCPCHPDQFLPVTDADDQVRVFYHLRDPFQTIHETLLD